MAVHASHAALPYPIKGARFSMLVPLLDADGDPTAATTPDTEISEDNAAATDAAEELSATSGMDGMALITFSGAETDCSCLAVNFKAASGPKATLATIFPRVLAEVGTGTLSAGSAGGGTLGTLLAYDVTGCFIKTTGGTGGGGTGGANNQVRKIITYNTGSGAFTVAPNWETTPSTDTTYAVLLPEGVTLGMLRTLNPTTAGRTLDVSSGGEAGVDWANVGSPTTTVGLSGTTVKTATDVETDTADIQSKIGTITDLSSGATIGANLVDIEAHADNVGVGGASLNAIPWNAAWDAEVESEVTDALNSYDPPTRAELTTDTNSILSKLLKYVQLVLRKDAAIATDNATEVTAINADGGSGAGAFANTTDSQEAIRDKETDIETDTADIQSRLPAALVSGRIDASVGAMAANVLTASALATDAVNEIVDQTWREAIADHSGTAGSTAEALNAAGAAGDPWTTALPGAYGAGSAGNIIGNNLNATVSSRATQTTADAIETDTQDIQSKIGTPSNLGGGATVAANLADIEGQTDDIGVAGAGLTALASAANLATLDGKADSILADTNELQTDWVNGGRLDLILDAILADTNELQTDWVNGGRLDLLIDAIKAKTDNLPASPAAVGSAMTLTSGERDAVAAALLDLAAGIETGLTLRQAMRLAVASAAGKLSGAATTTVTIRNIADDKNRITATVDADGNRTAITTDLT